jgi:hypothetical protein
MKKRFLLVMVVSSLTWVNLFAEEKAAEEKKLSYNVAVDFGSTYMWRGFDTYAHKLDAAGQSNSVFNFAPGIFPSVTVTANSGLSFNIWGARSLMARTIKDGELNAYDEMDFTGTYTIVDKSGTFTSSLIAYVFPTASYATGTAVALPSYGELVFSYTAPIILNPFVAIAGSMGPTGAEYEYANIGISHEFQAGILKITPKLLFGYWYMNQGTSTNKAHFDLNIPFVFGISENFEFHASLTGCYRAVGFADNINKYSPFILAAALGASFSF